ncbi:diacylglycerol/polyprenol kinase family protein [Acaryochloris marina]|uniref:diacylglycerol/polyprenol kinase family protein n=1 Tax=Acaryochloris marina TaxID=155978 RepID=UPI001BB06C29|nr:phosphatidate cytidylyltransferase [Acaryochloris marina]QUY43765.1 phosphatidate cytidylyltransferase [Acaryochloris marina S15]
MLWEQLTANPLLQDSVVMVITLLLALSWLRIMDALAANGVLEQKLSRKIIHMGTGPLFVLCWPFFSPQPTARYFAALVPLAITLQFIAIGVGWIQDPDAVQAMTRTGNPKEILKGPLFYGLVFVACTIGFWRTSPVGMLALMMMCGGDGLADIVGRRLGVHKLPFSPEKSWAGSAAMFAGSFLFAFSFLSLFNRLNYFQPPLAGTVGIVAAIALIATLVEALPFRDIDNLTLTGVAVVLGLWWF